jgi:hypothetical protein
MSTAAYNKYASAAKALTGDDDIAADTFKIALAATINANDEIFTPGTTDLSTGGGYISGGNIAATTSATIVDGILTLVLASPAIWNVTGAGFTFRYVILYNSTTGNLHGYWDYGTDQVMTDSETVSVVLNSIDGVFQVS